MTSTLAILLVCQLAGELVARLLRAPVPGPVLGMLLLFVVLSARPRTSAAVENGAQALLRHLSLLFVPAGAGVLRHRPRLRADRGCRPAGGGAHAGGPPAGGAPGFPAVAPPAAPPRGPAPGCGCRRT